MSDTPIVLRLQGLLSTSLGIASVRTTRLSVGLISLVLMAGCVGYYSYPDQARICRSTGAVAGWDSNGYYSATAPNFGSVRVHVHVSDVVTAGNHTWSDGSYYWIRVMGHSEGRRSFSRHQHQREASPPIPMLFHPNRAYIQFQDGKRTYAESVAFYGKRDGTAKPGSEPVPYLPVDLNADHVHRIPPQNHLWGSIYIRFPLAPPSPSSNWSIHLGTIQVGAVEAEIPPYSLCFLSGKSGLVGLRP
jgi:hypothetical protein